MKIGVVSDTHNNLKNIEIIINLFNDEKVSLVIHTGDITNANSLEKFSKLTSSKFFIRRLGKVKLQCPLDNGKFIYGNPPFSLKDEISLLRSLKIDILVIKNVGGEGSFVKVEAARAINISVIMIERPQKPWANGIDIIPGIFKWMDHNL